MANKVKDISNLSEVQMALKRKIKREKDIIEKCQEKIDIKRQK